MKKEKHWKALGLIIFAAAHVPAIASERIEVPIGHVFIVPQASDEPDPVEIVLDGILPNRCYRIADKTLVIDKDARKVSAHLFAYRRQSGPCADEKNLPNNYRPPVFYTLPIPLEGLASGNYEVVYPRPGLSDGSVPFTIEARTAAALTPLAEVSSIRLPAKVPGDSEIQASLAGLLANCSRMEEGDISIERFEDVFVVSPKVIPASGPACAETAAEPFKAPVRLGTLSEGRYLIHVRGADGTSVDRAFNVVVPDSD